MHSPLNLAFIQYVILYDTRDGLDFLLLITYLCSHHSYGKSLGMKEDYQLVLCTSRSNYEKVIWSNNPNAHIPHIYNVPTQIHNIGLQILIVTRQLIWV